MNILLVCNACINPKIIICKSSLLNDNNALLENDAIGFSKMLCFTHVTCILPTFLLFPGPSPFSKCASLLRFSKDAELYKNRRQWWSHTLGIQKFPFLILFKGGNIFRNVLWNASLFEVCLRLILCKIVYIKVIKTKD